MKAIKLHFTTPVHFGRGREEPDKSELIYHSDSLKSAIYSIGVHFFEEWKNEKKFCIRSIEGLLEFSSISIP